MGRRSGKIDPTACEHLVERLRHGRRRFAREHQPTIMTWLHMHREVLQARLDGMTRDNAGKDSEQSANYMKWLRFATAFCTYLMSQLYESWGARDWEIARAELWERVDSIPIPDPSEFSRLADDGCPHGE